MSGRIVFVRLIYQYHKKNSIEGQNSLTLHENE
jgi:hypothetical protein